MIIAAAAAGSRAPATATPCTVPTYPISGRVLTRDGAGIRAVRVTAVRSEDGYAWSGLTSAFGRYEFRIPNCGTFTVRPAARAYAFDQVNFTLPSDQFTDGRTIDFTAH